MAEFCKNERDIYEHLESALLRMAHDHILYDLSAVIIPAGLACAIKQWAQEIDNNDRCNEMCNRIDEWIRGHFETEVNSHE